MKIKIGCAQIDKVIEKIDGVESNGIHFTYTGKKIAINAIFECDAQDFESAKAAVKKVTKATPELAAMFVSVQAA